MVNIFSVEQGNSIYEYIPFTNKIVKMTFNFQLHIFLYAEDGSILMSLLAETEEQRYEQYEFLKQLLDLDTV